MIECSVFFANCVIQPRRVLLFPLTVEANVGTASFLRVSQTLKNMFHWIYSTHSPHFYQSGGAVGGVLGQTTEQWGFLIIVTSDI